MRARIRKGSTGRRPLAVAFGSMICAAVIPAATLAQPAPAIVPAPAPAPIQPPALSPAATGTATARNIVLKVFGATVRMPRVEARGTRLSNEALAKIFDPNDPAKLADRLKSLKAEKIFVPEIVIEVIGTGILERIVYRNTTYTSVADGKVAGSSSEEGSLSFRTSGTRDYYVGAFERTTCSNVDFGVYTRALTETRTDPAEPFATLYDTCTVADLLLKSRAFTAKIGNIAVDKFMQRPFATSLADLQRQLGGASDATPSPEQQRGAIAFVADVYDSIKIGSARLRDVSVRIGGYRGGSLEIERAGITNLANATLEDLSFDHFSLGAENLFVGFRALHIGGLDFRPSVEFMKAAALGSDELHRRNPRTFIPTFASIVADHVRTDIYGFNSGSDQRQQQFTADKVRLEASNYRLAIPTTFFADVEHFAMDPPPQPVAELGYISLDASGQIRAAWDESARTITVQSTASGRRMGTVSLKSLFSNVTADLFAGDPAVAQAAALAVAAKEAAVMFVNRGFVNRVLATDARTHRRSIEDTREQAITDLRKAMAQTFGSTPKVADLTEALVTFLKDPKSIEIAVKAPKGLSAADAPLLKNPADLIERLDIKTVVNPSAR